MAKCDIKSSQGFFSMATSIGETRQLANWQNKLGIILGFYVPLQRKIGHFRDVLPSQSLGLVLKKLNLTQWNQMFTIKSKDTIT